MRTWLRLDEIRRRELHRIRKAAGRKAARTMRVRRQAKRRAEAAARRDAESQQRYLRSRAGRGEGSTYLAGARPTTSEQYKIEQALEAGVLVLPERRDASARLKSMWFRACREHDRPFAIIHARKTATIELDLATHKSLRWFPEESVNEAEQLARSAARRGGLWEFHGGPELLVLPGVPLDHAPEVMRRLLALPVHERLNDHGNYIVHNAGWDESDENQFTS